MAVDPARLRDVSLFEGLADDDVAAMAERMEERTVGAGEHLAREGASGYFFFVIFEGRAEVDRGGDVVASLGPNDFFGETAIVDAVRRNATVTATSEMVVGAMFGADFAKFEHDSPELHARIKKVIADRNPVDS
jgi:CRP-like cAMP-binding protein